MELGDLILIPKLDNVALVNKSDGNYKSIDGRLCISSHHLLWSSRQGDGQELWLLYRNIDLIEKKLNTQSPGGTIILKCKDFHILQLDINSTDDLTNVALSIEMLTSQEQTLQYPFFNRPQVTNSTVKQIEDGWTAFAPVSEWSRLLTAYADEWRISYLNKDYKVCNSYPSAVIVPRHIEDKIIISSANFRDGGRFPVLCYRHEGGSILLRSSQPTCGTNGKRCKEDERLLNAVLGPGRRGYIIDTRSISQAQSSRAKGGGTEMDAAYPQWRKVHKAVPRPHDLADSFFKLIEACNDITCSTSQWISRLDNGGWLSAVQSALNAACVTAQCLHQEVAAVLVHGDSEAERVRLRLSERTCSLWSYINQPEILEKWLNPLYEPNSGVIWPSVAPISIQLWKELYLGHTSVAPWKSLPSCIKQIKQNYMAVRKVASQLQIQIKQAIEQMRSNPDICYEEENQDEHTCIAQLSLESRNT
ncbi:myotubularin-related protein 9 isoform X2 [Bombus affinis]|uniref:myotubularin-related protein 9 isoform X2 n=1 Tax=Bombus affinis TaxID=309941 RepID=UPI0021B8328E|nr:myotubularin-related protein 9 isoform X2 [Bombus affinis]